MKAVKNIFLFVMLFCAALAGAQPNWPAIKSNTTFTVADTSYASPYIQPINVGGWEDGLYITRDGKNLFSTYLPVDALSWITDLQLTPACFNFDPYFRPPLLNIDTVTNIWGCPNYMQSDIVIAQRTDTSVAFDPWTSSNLRSSFTMDGGAAGILLNADTFDVFVFTKDGPGTQNEDIMFLRNVPVNPSMSGAVPILSTAAQEDNPHIERLNDTTLLLFFDRARFIYYSLSYDNGTNWLSPILVTNVLNAQAPYDVQPHLWNDGTDWWVFFCANDTNGMRCIYKSKQLLVNDWNSWGAKQLVIAPASIGGGYGNVLAVGEPTLTQWGDLSFVVVYGNTAQPDTLNVFDCDPWFLPKKGSPLNTLNNLHENNSRLLVYPNPAQENITIDLSDRRHKKIKIYVYNSFGELMRQEIVTTPQKIDIADLPSGIYFIRPDNFSSAPIKFLKN